MGGYGVLIAFMAVVLFVCCVVLFWAQGISPTWDEDEDDE